MVKYRIFCGGKEHVSICDSSVEYEALKDLLLELLDIIPQLTVINDSYEWPSDEKELDNT